MDRQVITSIERLRVICREVEAADHPEEIVRVLREVLATPRQGPVSIGLAGPQLGYQLRILVMRYGDNTICMVNPVITKERGLAAGTEMCLSLPGIEVKVPRPKMVTVKGLNEYMRYVKYKLTGLDARVACHEIDHLDGKLIIDYEQ